jgi:hypothetical protein
MPIKEQLLQEIEQTPEPILEEVLNFLRTIKQQDAAQLSPDSGQESVGQQILRFAAEFRAGVPSEELAKLPSDGAEQHDHYIYGTPKRLTE